jgi:hypothetical protein
MKKVLAEILLLIVVQGAFGDRTQRLSFDQQLHFQLVVSRALQYERLN